jgi:hypothetical protein
LRITVRHITQNKLIFLFRNLSGCRDLTEVKEDLKLIRSECEHDFGKLENLLEYAKPADLIEIERDFNYSHWAVYAGEGIIIHLLSGEKGKAIVKEELLEEVLNGSPCRVNNLKKEAERRGLEQNPVDVILKTARDCVGQEFAYDLVYSNCEHFATRCYFGIETGFSLQGEATKDKPVLRDTARMAVKKYMESEVYGSS